MSLQVEIDAPWPAFHLRASFTAEQGTVGIFGSSGAGKTTLLEVIAGLRQAPKAVVELDGIVQTDTARRLHIPVRRRRIGYVPQRLSLFPHLTVRRNLLYGCPSASEHSAGPFSLAHVTEVLEIAPLLPRMPRELSGGEAQRAALARALLSRPRLLLLDEPLASLDAPLKARIIPYLQRVQAEFGLPTLHVSHDPGEIVALCAQVLVMKAGQAEALRPTSQVFAAHSETVYRLRAR